MLLVKYYSYSTGGYFGEDGPVGVSTKRKQILATGTVVTNESSRPTIVVGATTFVFDDFDLYNFILQNVDKEELERKEQARELEKKIKKLLEALEEHYRHVRFKRMRCGLIFRTFLKTRVSKTPLSISLRQTRNGLKLFSKPGTRDPPIRRI